MLCRRPAAVQVPQESVNALTGSLKPVYIKFLTKGKAYSQIFQVHRRQAPRFACARDHQGVGA